MITTPLQKRTKHSENIKYLSHDRMIDRGECLKSRPDFIIDCNTHFIVLEVDENQHKSYDNICEFNRMVNISQTLGMRTIFIRYNPDPYIDDTKKKYNPNPTIRKNILFKCIDRYKKIPNHYCEAEYLFYDNYVDNRNTTKIITEMNI